MEKKLLTAKEARELADTSNCQISRLTKEIEFAARENRTTLCWSVYDTSREVVKNVIISLEEVGYTVEPHCYNEDKPDYITDLIINW